MKTIITVLLLSLPAAAQAMGMPMRAGGCGTAGLHLAIALYAMIAALGYWVTQHAYGREAGSCVKRTGQAVGGILVVVGLLGLLCGVGSHIRKAMCDCSCGAAGPAGMMPPAPDEMSLMHPAPGGKNCPEPAVKKGDKTK